MNSRSVSRESLSSRPAAAAVEETGGLITTLKAAMKAKLTNPLEALRGSNREGQAASGTVERATARAAAKVAGSLLRGTMLAMPVNPTVQGSRTMAQAIDEKVKRLTGEVELTLL